MIKINKDIIPEYPSVGDPYWIYRRERYWYKPHTWFRSNYSKMWISMIKEGKILLGSMPPSKG